MAVNSDADLRVGVGHHGPGVGGVILFHDLFNERPFDGYGVSAKQPGLGFYLFVALYVVVAFTSVPLLVRWTKNVERQQQRQWLQDEFEEGEKKPEEYAEQQQQHQQEEGQAVGHQHSNDREAPSGKERQVVAGQQQQQKQYDETRDVEQQEHLKEEPVKCRSSVISSSSRRQLPSRRRQYSDYNNRQSSSSSITTSGSRIRDLLDQSYPDQDPDFLYHMRRSSRRPHGRRQSQEQGQQDEILSSHQQQEQQQEEHVRQKKQVQPTGTKTGSKSGSKAPTETSHSDVPSAATTTQLRNHRQGATSVSGTGAHAALRQRLPTADKKRLSDLVLDVNSRRWKSRRPIGRPDVIANAIAYETNSVTSGRRRITSSIISDAQRGGTTTRSMVGPHQSKNNDQDENARAIQHPATIMSVGMRSSSKRRSTIMQQSQRGMSDVASSILSEQHHQLNQPSIHVDVSQLKHDQRQQQILQFQQQQHHQHPAILHRLQALQRQQYEKSIGIKAAGGSSRRGSWLGGRSVVSQSNKSAMSSIMDDISPEDAADANDPGRGNIFLEDENLQYLQNVRYRNGNYQGFGVQAACLTTPIEALLRLAMPDDDKWRVVRTSIPLSIGASSEALFRLISASFISQYIGTESMVAFLLVGLFVRLTSEEMAGAVVDALSSFVQASMYSANLSSAQHSNDSTGMYIAGQYVQLACIIQLVLQVPLLIVWAVAMEPIVFWFTSSNTTAAIAQEYTVVVIVAYLVQAISRTLTVIFHICGHEHFESVIDMASSMIQVIAISCVVSLVDDINLTVVAYIQVLITITSAITKVIFPVMRGWMRPIRKGLLQNMAVVQNKAGLSSLLRATFFLMCGAILEYGQWELLTIFVRFLGPAEVATWVLMGAVWDFVEAFTEGIGEAAANQVAFLLSLGHAQLAKELSFSSAYWAFINSLLMTSALLMSGQYLAVLFSTDPTIQHLFNNTVAMIGAANITMAFSQINWSLIGSQGRFRLGTVIVFFSRWFVTIPVAAISIFVFNLDLNSVSGSLVVGYSTASSALLFVLLRSDWVRLAGIMQAMNVPPNKLDHYKDGKMKETDDAGDPGLGELDLDDFDDSSDGSDGFGFGGPADGEEN